jgi:hypothetical protein
MNHPRPHAAARRALLVIAGLSLWIVSLRPLAAAANASTIDSFSFEHGTLERIFELRVPEGTSTASLEIRVRVEKGRVSWRLEDSEGKGRLNGEGIRGRVTGTTGPIEDPPTGIWTLSVATQNATGSARLVWETDSPAGD